VIALAVWGVAIVPSSHGPGGFTIEGYRAFEDALRNTLIAGVLIGAFTMFVGDFAWSRLVEGRRFGDHHAPRRRGDGSAWLVCWTLFLLAANVWKPWTRDRQIADISTETGAWFVLPAHAASWFIVAVAAWPIFAVTWRAVSDSIGVSRSPARHSS
jgi:hypothetical protein